MSYSCTVVTPLLISTTLVGSSFTSSVLNPPAAQQQQHQDQEDRSYSSPFSPYYPHAYKVYLLVPFVSCVLVFIEGHEVVRFRKVYQVNMLFFVVDFSHQTPGTTFLVNLKWRGETFLMGIVITVLYFGRYVCLLSSIPGSDAGRMY